MFSATPPAHPWSRDPGVWGGAAVVGVIAALDAVARVQLTGGYAVGAIVAAMLTDARRTAGAGTPTVQAGDDADLGARRGRLPLPGAGHHLEG